MTAADFLIANGGRLDPAWYAPLVLTDLLTAWLAGATGTDQQVEAAVYTRAYEALADQVMFAASSERVGAIAVSRSDEQLRYWARQAAYWRGQLDALSGRSGPVLTEWEGDPIWRN